MSIPSRPEVRVVPFADAASTPIASVIENLVGSYLTRKNRYLYPDRLFKRQEICDITCRTMGNPLEFAVGHRGAGGSKGKPRRSGAFPSQRGPSRSAREHRLGFRLRRRTARGTARFNHPSGEYLGERSSTSSWNVSRRVVRDAREYSNSDFAPLESPAAYVTRWPSGEKAGVDSSRSVCVSRPGGYPAPRACRSRRSTCR